MSMKLSTLTAEVSERRDTPGTWGVEAIDIESGECYVTLFAGPSARERAVEYAIAKYAAALVD